MGTESRKDVCARPGGGPRLRPGDRNARTTFGCDRTKQRPDGKIRVRHPDDCSETLASKHNTIHNTMARRFDTRTGRLRGRTHGYLSGRHATQNKNSPAGEPDRPRETDYAAAAVKRWLPAAAFFEIALAMRADPLCWQGVAACRPTRPADISYTHRSDSAGGPPALRLVPPARCG